MDVKLFLSMASTSAVGFTARRGPGSLKHKDLKYLSLQDDVREGAVKADHVAMESRNGEPQVGEWMKYFIFFLVDPPLSPHFG